VSFANDQARLDLRAGSTAVKPALVSAISALDSNYDLTITSVAHGGHVKNSAHYDGRAADVGAVNGTAIGPNTQTWDFVRDAIASGKIQKLGTFAAIANDASMQEWAAEHGVELFVDTGSGPHVHLQVAP